jgi:hypothetical protein
VKQGVELTKVEPLARDASMSRAGVFEAHTFWPILGMVALGLALAAGALAAFECVCAGYATGLCGMARSSPPWLFVTGIAAAPAAVLTWYWRTAHRKRDLAHREAEQRTREREIAHTLAEAESAQFEKANAELRACLPMLTRVDAEAHLALGSIARIGERVPGLSRAAIETLTGFLRHSEVLSAAAQREHPSLRQRAVGIALALRRMDPGLPLDLRDANLTRLDLRGTDFSRADLRGADFSEAQLQGANFENARLSNVKAHRAVIERVESPSVQHNCLLAGGAREVDPGTFYLED